MTSPDHDLMITELLEQRHAGALSDVARDELRQRLLADPALRQEARAAAHLHQLLADWFDPATPARTAQAVDMLLDAGRAGEGERLARAVGRDLTARGGALAARPVRRWWAAAAAAVLAMAAGLWFLMPRPTATDGQGRALASGATVGGTTAQSIRWSDGSTIELAAGSRGTLDGDARDKRIDLRAGHLVAEVRPQASGSFTLVAPHGEIRVIGTRFRVTTSDRATTVQVDGGNVRVRARDQERVLAAGEAARLTTGGIDLLPPLDAGSRELLTRHPPVLVWADRRPIGMFIVAFQRSYPPGNPNGWFEDPRLDVRTPEGQAEVRRRVLDSVDQAIVQLRRMGAQGVVWWNPEGSRWLQRFGFIGDATRLGELSPETDLVADEAMARFAAAGLRTGVIVRPWVISGTGDDLRVLEEPARMLEQARRRIAYAHRRWGCTIFPVMHAYTGWSGAGLSSEELATLAQEFPQTLLFPDRAALANRSVTAGWSTIERLQSGDAATEELVSRMYPGSPLVFHRAQHSSDVAIPAAVRGHIERGCVPLVPVPHPDDDPWRQLRPERLGNGNP